MPIPSFSRKRRLPSTHTLLPNLRGRFAGLLLILTLLAGLATDVGAAGFKKEKEAVDAAVAELVKSHDQLHQLTKGARDWDERVKANPSLATPSKRQLRFKLKGMIARQEAKVAADQEKLRKAVEVFRIKTRPLTDLRNKAIKTLDAIQSSKKGHPLNRQRAIAAIIRDLGKVQGPMNSEFYKAYDTFKRAIRAGRPVDVARTAFRDWIKSQPGADAIAGPLSKVLADYIKDAAKDSGKFKKLAKLDDALSKAGDAANKFQALSGQPNNTYESGKLRQMSNALDLLYDVAPAAGPVGLGIKMQAYYLKSVVDSVNALFEGLNLPIANQNLDFLLIGSGSAQELKTQAEWVRVAPDVMFGRIEYFELRMDRKYLVEGEPFTVHYRKGANFDSDAWVGVIASGAPHGKEKVNDSLDVERKTLNAERGALTFRAPISGKWDVRLHDDDDDGKEVAYVSFITTPKGKPKVTPSKAVFAYGEKITVIYSSAKGYARPYVQIVPAGHTDRAQAKSLDSLEWGEFHSIPLLADGSAKTSGSFDFNLTEPHFRARSTGFSGEFVVLLFDRTPLSGGEWKAYATFKIEDRPTQLKAKVGSASKQIELKAPTSTGR